MVNAHINQAANTGTALIFSAPVIFFISYQLYCLRLIEVRPQFMIEHATAVWFFTGLIMLPAMYVRLLLLRRKLGN